MSVRSLFYRPCRQSQINRTRSDAQNQLARLIVFPSMLADTRKKWSDCVSVDAFGGVVK